MSKEILIVDNYDSFTDNLHHLLARIRPNYNYSIKRNDDKSILSHPCDLLVISPGPYGPKETGYLKTLFSQKVLPSSLPVLGVCLGMQFLAWYYGLTVAPSGEALHGRTVDISHKGEDIFAGLPSPFKAVRYNSLAVKETPSYIEDNSPLRVTAVEEDNGMIMGLTHKDLPISALQFHPESFLTEQASQLTENFFSKVDL